MSSQLNEMNGSISNMLLMLERNNLLNPQNSAVVTTHANSNVMARALSSLQEAGILTQDNFTVVATPANPTDLSWTLSYLQKAGILTQANLDIVATHVNPKDLSWTLSSLEADILTQDNFTVVATHTNLNNLSWALSRLKDTRMLNQENLDVVAAHANPCELVHALYHLANACILTPENRDAIASHGNPQDLAFALYRLEYLRISTRANRNTVASHADPLGLVNPLYSLQEAGILNQTNFNSLATPNHATLVTEGSYQAIWSRLPQHLLTQANFERLMIASEHLNPIEELERVINDILGLRHDEAAQAFNGAQSTHTTSVHRSVSEAAIKLMTSYGEGLNMDVIICEIRAYVNSLPSSLKNDAAKRCITRITAPDNTFTDSSDVSTRQLLALAYSAIHDDTKRIGTRDDGLTLFVDGLYEIQRGYNINEQGIDNKAEDSHICLAGTFNKLMEKLNGIHTDVTVYYITHDGASLKFPRLAEVHAVRYLKSITSPETETEYQQCKAILDTIQKDNSLACIWDNIKDNVIEELWDEFKEAYANNPHDKHYLDLITYGPEHLQAPKEIVAIQQHLQASPGYQQMIGLHMRDLFNFAQSPTMVRLHQHSLWANRHAIEDAQKDFDKRFG